VEILVERSAQTGQEQRVVVPSRVIAALSQLEGTEQDAVRAAFQAIGREGVRSTAGIDVRRVDAPDPFYVLYLDAAPDVLILARAPTRPSTSWTWCGPKRCRTCSTPTNVTTDQPPGFMALTFDPAQCRADLDLFERLLAENPDLSEREQILPFFRAHPHLSLLLGVYNPGVVAIEILAYELSLFGQFTSDVVVGDWRRKRYCLVEFEDGKRNSIFVRRGARQTTDWTPRFLQIDQAVVRVTESLLMEVVIACKKRGLRQLMEQHDDSVIGEPLVSHLDADLAYRDSPTTHELPLMLGDVLVEEVHPATSVGS